MGSKEKLLKKFYRKPVPNDITFQEVCTIASHFGCVVRTGGTHVKIAYKPLGAIVPIPRHGNCVEEAYICQLKSLFDRIKEEASV